MKHESTKPGLFRRVYGLYDNAIGEILREMVGELAPIGRLFFRFGAIFALLSAWMAWQFGEQVSIQHAIGLAAVALMVAFAPHAAQHLWSVKGEKGAAVAAIVGTVLFGAIELTSHLGYTSSSRAMNTGEAKVMNATYTGAQNAVSEDQEALKTAKDSLAQLKLAHPWAATVTADALRAQLPPIDVSLKREANNCGRRKCATPDEGKGPAWQILAKQKADLEERIAIAESRNGIAIRIADLEKRLAERRSAAAGTEFKHSAVANSTAFIGNIVRVVTGEAEPSRVVQERAELVWTILQSVGFSLAAMFCFWMAGRFRLDLLRRKEGEPGILDAFAANLNRHLPAGVAPYQPHAMA